MLYRRFFLISCLLLTLVNCDGVTDPNPPIGIIISANATFLEVGDTVALTASVYGKTGELVNNARLIWSTSDRSIAEIVGSGGITGRAPGNVTLTGRVGNAIDSIAIVVVARGTSRNNISCAGHGTRHFDLFASGTWTAAQSPHFIRDTIAVSHLTIEAGALVCAYPGAQLVLKGELKALGTANREIRFVATDTTRTWSGIVGGIDAASFLTGSIVFNHVHVENATTLTTPTLWIDSSSFLKTRVASSDLTLRNSVVEGGDVAFSNGTLANTIVRRGSLNLVYDKHASKITIDGGRIEDSPSTSLLVGSINAPGAPVLTVINPPTIIGSRGPIVDMPVDAFFQMWPTPELQGQLLNNQNKTVTLWTTGFGTFPGLHLRKGLIWTFRAYGQGLRVNNLTIDPGVTVDLRTSIVVDGSVTANGSPSDPIRISSDCRGLYTYDCALSLAGTANSTVSYVNFDKAQLEVGESNTARIDHVDSNSMVTVGSPGSSISDLFIHDLTFSSTPPATALRLGSPGIIVQRVTVRRVSQFPTAAISIEADGVHIIDCEITDNAGDGIAVIFGTGAQIHDCNLERNAGFGVNNRTSSVVDAKRNWWGDAAGPNGPNGDGTSGGVDFSQPLTARRRTSF